MTIEIYEVTILPIVL